MPRQRRIWRLPHLSAFPLPISKSRCYNCRTLQLPGSTSRVCNERGIAQPGRALRSGRRGRRFESSFPDQGIPTKKPLFGVAFLFAVRRSGVGSLALAESTNRHSRDSGKIRTRNVWQDEGRSLLRGCDAGGTAAAVDASRRGSENAFSVMPGAARMHSQGRFRPLPY